MAESGANRKRLAGPCCCKDGVEGWRTQSLRLDGGRRLRTCEIGRQGVELGPGAIPPPDPQADLRPDHAHAPTQGDDGHHQRRKGEFQPAYGLAQERGGGRERHERLQQLELPHPGDAA